MPAQSCAWVCTCMCSHTYVDMHTHMHISHTKMGKERIHVLYGFHFFIPVFIPSRVHPRGLAKIFFSKRRPFAPLSDLQILHLGAFRCAPSAAAFPVSRPLYFTAWDPSSEASSPSNPYALPLCHAKVLRNKRLVCFFLLFVFETGSRAVQTVLELLPLYL